MALLATLKKKMHKEKETARLPEKEMAGIKAPDKPKKSPQDAFISGAGFSDVLVRPHITEKTTHLAASHRYTFLISPRATKRRVKEAIEHIYRVGVTGVNIIHIPAKIRTRGRFVGKKLSYRKAVIRLKEGDSITEFLQA